MDIIKEMERRGHKFVRYADDVNVYTRSRRAAQRVLLSCKGSLYTVKKNSGIFRILHLISIKIPAVALRTELIQSVRQEKDSAVPQYSARFQYSAECFIQTVLLRKGKRIGIV